MNYNIKIIKGRLKERLSVITIICISITNISAQTPYQNKNIFEVYSAYSKLPRELAYTHLNKSIYIKGEYIGFTTYVFDKHSKNPSTVTRNLYCTVSDSSNNIIKSKLIKVVHGIANNVFNIDSLFTSGNYVFKAYTNYMRNFKERNYFSQEIRIIDPDKETVIKPKKVKLSIDAQFLPESGHLIAGVSNVVGVVLKDSSGFGIPLVEGVLKDAEENSITNFKVNKLGIGRFSFKPETNEACYVELNYNNKNFKFEIKNIEPKGIALELKTLNNKIGLLFKTNAKTLTLIQNNNYKLIIHNGQDLKEIPIQFSNKTEVIKLIKQDHLFLGMNVFTLFDAYNNPILERLFFNYEGINLIKSDAHIVTQEKDSTTITLSYKNINPNIFNNLSVSILPSNTKSYGAHHNIISYTHLQPYINGYIENGSYYFNIINNKTKYDLDNLLITQGWSAYNWNTIFNHPPVPTYNFDVGISFKAKVKRQKEQRFLVHPLDTLEQPEFYPISKTDKGFLVIEKQPKDNDSITISEVRKNGKLFWTNLSLDFYPKAIPYYKTSETFLGDKELILTEATPIKPFSETSLDKTQHLDEVVVTGKYKLTKIDKIKIKQQGQVEVFDDKMRNFYITFEEYIIRKGYYYKENPNGSFNLVNRSVAASSLSHLAKLGNGRFPKPFPTVYIDGLETRSEDYLRRMPMENIEYIKINKNKAAYSDRLGGVIHIITNSKIAITEKNKKVSSKYRFPLTFSSVKKFYRPKYNSYTSPFFKEYGVIGWFPKNQINEEGKINLKFYNEGFERVNLFIEGVSNDGSFISEIKTVTVN